MKNKQLLLICVLVIFFISGSLIYCQEEKVDRTTVPFSDPSKPGLVKGGNHRGGITVTGYKGEEVIVEASTRGSLVSDERNSKSKGMKLIRINTTGLSIEEEDNVIEIETESHKRVVDLNIKVPISTSLELGSYRDGDIIVENVNGEIEVSNYRGSIKLSNVSGTVVASTYSGEILVTFTKVNPNNPMSFTNYRGDIDVTFPADSKFNLRMKSDRANIYSDFDIVMSKSGIKKIEDKKKKGGKYRISFEGIYGKINGGGPDIIFKSYSGNIYIRKRK